jgi:hypothetical protein
MSRTGAFALAPIRSASVPASAVGEGGSAHAWTAGAIGAAPGPASR